MLSSRWFEESDYIFTDQQNFSCNQRHSKGRPGDPGQYLVRRAKLLIKHFLQVI